MKPMLDQTRLCNRGEGLGIASSGGLVLCLIIYASDRHRHRSPLVIPVEAKMEYSELTFVSMTLVVSHRKVTRGKEIQSPYKVITQKQ